MAAGPRDRRAGYLWATLSAASAGASPTDADRVVPPIPVDAQREVLGIERGEVEDVIAGVGGEREPVAARRPPLDERLEVGEVVRELEGRLEQHVEGIRGHQLMRPSVIGGGHDGDHDRRRRKARGRPQEIE